MRYHKACEDCVLNHDGCLLQENEDVDECSDVIDYEREKANEERDDAQSNG